MDAAQWIRNVQNDLNKLPEGMITNENLLDVVNVSRLEGLVVQTSEIIVRLYSGTNLEDIYLNKLKIVNPTFMRSGSGTFLGIPPKNFDLSKVMLAELLRSMQLSLSCDGIPPKKEPQMPATAISNLVATDGSNIAGHDINQQLTILEIIDLLERAVKEKDIPDENKNDTIQKLRNLKNDPVLSQLLASSIAQFAGFITGSSPAGH
jgi:hypothetical protein